MDYIKEAFNKIKQDVELLRYEINQLKEENDLYKNHINSFEEFITNIRKEVSELKRDVTLNKENQTNSINFQTDNIKDTTNKQPFKPLRVQNNTFSIGNGGVPTDKQTNRQTDKHINYALKKEDQEGLSIDNALNLLNSLDSIKKEIRIKFKKLTDQELLIFSTIYQFDEEVGHSNYKMISNKLGLTESSIRDYIGKLIKKGIPVEKIKVNNKNINLNISENLKKIASLSAILQLREI